jgi:hypothetical protein
MINKLIMNKNDIVDVIEIDDDVIDVSLRHKPEIQRRFVVQIIPPCC